MPVCLSTFSPRACYSEAKRLAETLIKTFHDQYKIDTRIARVFNTYGPRISFDDGRVVGAFIKQSFSNKELTIYGDGLQTRSFCYVDDLINAFMNFMKTENNFTGPVNIGNPNEFTIIDLAKNVIKLTNSKSKIILFGQYIGTVGITVVVLIGVNIWIHPVCKAVCFAFYLLQFIRNNTRI